MTLAREVYGGKRLMNRTVLKSMRMSLLDAVRVSLGRGETLHVESRMCLGNKASGDCVWNIPEDSFVRHLSRHFHGAWI